MSFLGLPRRIGSGAGVTVPGTSEVIGRESELRVLGDFVSGLDGRSAAVLLAGEAGTGKTTLWQVAVETARVEGHRVLVTRPAAAEARLGFAGLRDLLEDVVSEVLDAVPGPQADVLRVALLLERPGRTAVEQPVVAAAVLSALRARTPPRPGRIAGGHAQRRGGPAPPAGGFPAPRL